jgi:hypothetical protein
MTAVLRDALGGQGADPVGSTPEEYAAQNRTDFVKYAKVVKLAGVKAE